MPHVTFADGTPYAINTIYCIGRSYAEHIAELGNSTPDEPLIFIKPNSSLVMGDALCLPDFSDDVHHEVELVLLIGENKQIIGCAVGLDLTARDVQNLCKAKGLPWLKAKGFKHACWLSDFMPFENKHYTLTLAVNEQVRQHDSTAKLMYDFAYLLNHIDTLYGLQAGDVIMTGTPKGVGKLTRGDQLQVSLDEKSYALQVC